MQITFTIDGDVPDALLDAISAALSVQMDRAKPDTDLVSQARHVEAWPHHVKPGDRVDAT